MTLKVALAGQVTRDFALDVKFDAMGITALLGPSGSGKTSVLRAIAGLDLVPGAVSFKGNVWQDGATFLPAHRRQVGYVFQGAGLLPHLSVRQNLDFAAKRAPTGPFDRTDVIAATGVGPLQSRNTATLSGGEQQRANIARALLSQPQLLLLDEPLSGLDDCARGALLAALAVLLRAVGLPALYVTHDIAEAEQIANHHIWLDQGRARVQAAIKPFQE